MSLLETIYKNKVHIFVSFIFVFSSFLLFSDKKAFGCACGSGEYQCESNTMCCTGHGCPSSYCEWGQGGVWSNGKCCDSRQDCSYTRNCIDWGQNCVRTYVCEEDASGRYSCFYKQVCTSYCKEYEQVCETVLYNCKSPDPADTCSWCPVEPPPPPCTQSPIGTSMTTQTDKATYITTDNIHFSWTAPAWGTCCANCALAGFDVYVDSVLIYSAGTGTLALDKIASTFAIGNHSWYVIAKNGNAGTTQSSTKTFTVNFPSGNVEGSIWDSTGSACSLGSKESKEIQRTDLSGGVSPTVDALVGVWNPSEVGKSYTVPNVMQGNSRVLCANLPAPSNKPGFKYNLTCLNNSTTGVFSGSCAYIDVASFPTRADLGFKLLSSGWSQVLGGDVFAGCSSCIDSVSMGIPITSEILGGFGSSFIEGVGSLFANSDVSIKDSSGTAKITSTSGNKYYSKNIGAGDLWPETFSFTPPSNAEEVTGDCRYLFERPRIVPRGIIPSTALYVDNSYKADISCIQGALDNVTTGYRAFGSGVVVIYVTGDGTLTFTKNFASSSARNRILFITEGGVEVSSAVGDAAPTNATAPHIQAGIIAKQSIKFLGKGTPDDTTIVVEGPLVTKEGNVDFARDRGLANGYPGVVVKYNPIFLNAFSTSLGEYSISWELQN